MASGMVEPSSVPYNVTSCPPQLPPRAASMALSLFYAVLLLFSALGNILALCLTCQKDKKINSTGVYLIHLAVSDLLFTLALPGKITYYVLDFNWPFGDSSCRLMAFIMYLNTYGGLYLMACVSVDRYLAVVRTHPSPGLRSANRAKLICVLVWVCALLQTMPLLLTPMAMTVADKETCMEYISVEAILGLPVMVLVACVVSFCGPAVTILFCYVKIALKLCSLTREKAPSSRTGHSRRACLLTLVVLVTAVSCFCPYHLNVIQFMVRQMLGPPSCAQQRAFTLALQVTVTLMNVNCGIDPIIYFFASTRYRKWLLDVLRLGASSSVPSSSSPAKASSDIASSNQREGSASLAENEV